jgi:16S rRNA C967 or C1407 C5-methylase (RsmB/RsmF family)
MSKNSKSEKRLASHIINKQKKFSERVSQIFNLSLSEAEELINTNSMQAVRASVKFNDKFNYELELSKIGVDLEKIEWAPLPAWWVKSGQTELNKSNFIEAGELYVQNAASFLPIMALGLEEGDKVLDLCAAPGGKSDLILSLGVEPENLHLNDNSRVRFFKMKSRFDSLNLSQINYSIYNLKNITRHKKDYVELFDKILLDAPCSNEASIKLNKPKTLKHWSEAHIKRLRDIQRSGILAASDFLKPGGTLVYSTCTFAPEENEGVVQYFLKKHPEFELQDIKFNELKEAGGGIISWRQKPLNTHGNVTKALRIKPSIKMHGFFIAKFKRR